MLVVGDNADSEIKAGLDQGMPVILFDSPGLFTGQQVDRIKAGAELVEELQA